MSNSNLLSILDEINRKSDLLAKATAGARGGA